jgi:GPI mannosyltransferase 3
VYCLDRTPFETPSHLPLTFYQRSAGHIRFQKWHSVDSLRQLPGGWVAVTYNDAKDGLLLLDSLGYKPVLYSSSALWGINRFLHSRNKHTINDIWALYRK